MQELTCLDSIIIIIKEEEEEGESE